MSKDTPHTPLIEQARPFLEVIKAHGGKWVSRGEIAKGMNLVRLNSYHVAMLEYLQEQGLLEVEKIEDLGPLDIGGGIGLKEVIRPNDHVMPGLHQAKQ